MKNWDGYDRNWDELYADTEADAAPRPAPPGKRSLTGSGLRSEWAETPGKVNLTGGVAFRKAMAGGGRIAPAAARRMDGARGESGAPLPGELQGDLESAAGADLSGVRVHTGDGAASAAGALGAEAYAEGQDIYFAAGRFEPGSQDGQALIAHEVAHTVQQAGAPQASSADPQVSSPTDSLEVEADRFATAFVAGGSAPLSSGGAGVAHRDITDQPAADADPDAPAVAPSAPAPGAPAGGEPAQEERGPAIGDAGAAGGPSQEAQVTGGGGDAAPAAAQEEGGGAAGGEGGQQAAGGEGGAAADGGEVATEEVGAAPGGPQPAADGGGVPAEPPMTADIPQLTPFEPISMPEPAPLGPEETRQWVEQTGRGPAEHRAQIQSALDGLGFEVEMAQQSLSELGARLRGELEAFASEKAVQLQGTVAAGRGQVEAAYQGIGGGLDGVAETARAAIEARRVEGEANLQAAQTEKRAALDEAFASADLAVDNVVVTQSPAFVEILTAFSGRTTALGETKKTAADTEATRIKGENDPASLLDGGLSGARAAMRASIKQACTDTATTAAKNQIDARVGPFAENLEQQAAETVLGLIEPYQADLQTELDNTRITSDANFEAAGERALGELTAGAEAATTAVDEAVTGGRDRATTAETDALTSLETAAMTAEDNLSACGEEVGSRLELRAAEDASAMANLVNGLRAMAEAERPMRFEQAQPLIEQVRAEIALNLETSGAALEGLAGQGRLEIESILASEEATFQAAVDDQLGQAEALGQEITTNISTAGDSFGANLDAIVATFGTEVQRDLDGIAGAIDTFEVSANAGVESQRELVGTRLNDVYDQLGTQLDTLVSNIEVETDRAVTPEYNARNGGIAGKVSNLRSAMDGVGTDESKIYAQLRDASWGEIELIEETYDDHYAHRSAGGRTPLRADIYDEMSGSDYRTAIAYLNHDRDTALRLELEDSTAWYNDDEERIEAVLRCASDAEINTLVTDSPSTLEGVRGALGGCDLDTVDALLDTSITREQRHTRADAIRLFDAMEGWGTDEARVRQLLESAGTPEQRQALRDQFNTYAEAQGWGTEGGMDRLDSALADDFSGQELNVMEAFARVERDDNEIRAARLLFGAEGAGTDEHEMFDALDDAQYAQMYANAPNDEARAELARRRREALDAQVRNLSDFDSVDAVLDDDMGARGPITYLELRNGQKEDGSPIEPMDRYRINLEREVAQRKLETGTCEPDLQIRYAVFGDGTDEDLIKKALGNGGQPKPRAAVDQICADYSRIWGQTLRSHNELARLDFDGFAEPTGVLNSELSGRDWLDVRELLMGAPNTPEELRYVTLMKHDFETSGIIGGGLMVAADAMGFTDTNTDLEAQTARFEEAWGNVPEELRSRPLSELEDGGQFERIAAYLQADARAYGEVKAAFVDAIVTTLEIIGGVLATIATAGASSPVLAAIIANLVVSAAGIAVRALAMGDAYGAEQFAQDFVMAVGTAGIAAAEAKAFSGAATRVADAMVRRTAVDAAEEAGMEVAEGGLRVASRGRELLHRSIESAARTVMTESANTVLSTVTQDQFWEGKLEDALWGENSLGAKLIMGIPRHMASGFVAGAMEPFATQRRSYAGTAIATALQRAGANTAGILMYVDSYQDAQRFWDDLLSSNVQALASGAFDGLAGHRARARNLAADVVRGDVQPGQLDEMPWLADSERREIAEHMHDAGHGDMLPESYRQYLPTGADTATSADGDGATTTTTTDDAPPPVHDEADATETPPAADPDEALAPRADADETEDATTPRRDGDETEDTSAPRRDGDEEAEEGEVRRDDEHEEDSTAPAVRPHVDADAADADATARRQRHEADEGILDTLNHGTVEQLTQIDGIDEAQARAIIAERERRRTERPDAPAFGKVLDIASIGGTTARQAGDLQARQKWAQLELDDGPAAALLPAFREEFDRLRADPAHAELSDYELMRRVVSADPDRFCRQGAPVPLEALQEQGAFSRVVGMWSVYDYHLTPAAKAQLLADHGIDSPASFAAAMAANPGIFSQDMLDPSSMISGQNGVAWWAPRGESTAGTASELIGELALDPSYYEGGAIRFTMSPDDAHGQFRKPTPFDGMMFGEWVSSRGDAPLGVTGGGSPEVVAPGIAVGSASSVEVFTDAAAAAPSGAHTSDGGGDSTTSPVGDASGPPASGDADATAARPRPRDGDADSSAEGADAATTSTADPDSPEAVAMRRRAEEEALSADPDGGTAAAVPGSSFHGQGRGDSDPDAVHAAVRDVLRADSPIVAAVLPREATVSDGAVTLQVAGAEVRISIEVGPAEGGATAAAVARFVRDGDGYRIIVSAGARDVDIPRALAHELAEIQQVAGNRAAGRHHDTTDALAEGSQTAQRADGRQEPALSPHDHGRLAELRVLESQLAGADGPMRAELQREMQALLLHLGLLETGAAPAPHPDHPEWQRLAGDDAVEARLRLIADAGAMDEATMRRLIEEAHAMGGVGELRTRVGEQREADREAMVAQAHTRLRARAAEVQSTIAGLAPDACYVFHLILGSGWTAVARYAGLGEPGFQPGQKPDVLIVGPMDNPEPWITRGDLAMGQGPNELQVDGFRSQPADFQDDQQGFVRADAFGAAVADTRLETGAPTLPGFATGQVESKPAGGWPPEPGGREVGPPASEALHRVLVRGEDGREFYMYADYIDHAGSAGPARTIGAPEFTDPLLRTAQGETDADGAPPDGVMHEDPDGTLRDLRPEFRRLVFGDEQLLTPTPAGGSVLVIGGGAAAAWNVENAVRGNAGTVEWAGRIDPVRDAQVAEIRSRIAEAETRVAADASDTAAHAELAAARQALADTEERAALARRIADGSATPEDMERADAIVFERARIRRNVEGEGSAFDPALEASGQVQRSVREIERIVPEGGQVRVFFKDGGGDPAGELFDQVVMSIGQDPNAEGAPLGMVQGLGPLEPIEGPDGSILGVQTSDGKVQLLGYAGTHPQTMGQVGPTEGGQGFSEAVGDQAGGMPVDSSGLPLIRFWGRRIGANTEALLDDPEYQRRRAEYEERMSGGE